MAELAERAGRSDGPRADAIGREIAGLAAIVESHFAYEERAIGAALDREIPDTGWSEAVFACRGGPSRIADQPSAAKDST